MKYQAVLMISFETDLIVTIWYYRYVNSFYLEEYNLAVVFFSVLMSKANCKIYLNIYCLVIPIMSLHVE